jgi:uncharacterized peroxidase-related enzyme
MAWIQMIDTAAAQADLLEAYRVMAERPMPSAYRPPHGGAAGIQRAHSLDPALMQITFAAIGTMHPGDALTWAERELIASVAARTAQCLYWTSAHAEFLRVASRDEEVAAGVIRAGAGAFVARSPRERALAGFAALITTAPWTLTRADLDRLRAVGLPDEGVVQAVTIGALFNYVTRVADAIGLEFDYESPLPRLQVDVSVEPLPRPDREGWPALDVDPALDPGAALSLSLALRPASAAAFERWRAHVFERDAPISRRDRAVLGRAAAFHVCDAAGVSAFADAAPTSPREAALAAYATKLTLAPWQMTEADLAPLRRESLDDAALLHVVAVVALQNTLSRIRLALGAPRW